MGLLKFSVFLFLLVLSTGSRHNPTKTVNVEMDCLNYRFEKPDFLKYEGFYLNDVVKVDPNLFCIEERGISFLIARYASDTTDYLGRVFGEGRTGQVFDIKFQFYAPVLDTIEQSGFNYYVEQDIYETDLDSVLVLGEKRQVFMSRSNFHEGGEYKFRMGMFKEVDKRLMLKLEYHALGDFDSFEKHKADFKKIISTFKLNISSELPYED